MTALLEAGARRDVRNDAGKTPLELAEAGQAVPRIGIPDEEFGAGTEARIAKGFDEAVRLLNGK